MKAPNNKAQVSDNKGFKSQMSRIGQKALKGVKVASGYQAYQDWKCCRADKKKAEEIRSRVEELLEQKKSEVNARLNELYKLRVDTLRATVKVFISYLDILNQKVKDKEYSFPTEFDIHKEEVKEFPSIIMPREKTIKLIVTELVGGGASVASTPKLILEGVKKVGKAGTKKKIKELNGIAAEKAAMAWLGGGPVAAGGGGVATGTIVLGAITATVTAIVVVSAAGTLASGFYSKKKTETDEYLSEMEKWAANIEQQGVGIEKIELRISELEDCTIELTKRAKKALEDFKKYLDKFNPSRTRHQRKFLQCSELIRSISEILKADILDEDGNINEITSITIRETRTFLNKAL